MANININRKVDDQFYRYKMPKLIAKVEGKGNGIKTVIVNMVEIAKALDRPPTYPTKFFGCELGAQTQFDIKNERFIVNGSHEGSKLQDLLDNFIKKFVLCHECGNPETKLMVSQKKQTIGQQCAACGHVAQVDMRHKLTTFIVKNPPEVDPAAVGPTANKKERQKQKEKKDGEKKAKKAANGEGGGEEDEPDSPPTVANQSSVGEDEDDWGSDAAEDTQQRIEELTDAAKKLMASEELEKTTEERLEMFYKFVEARKETGVSGTEKEKEIVSEAEHLEVKDKAVTVLVEVLLDTGILTQLKTYRNLLIRFTHGSAKAQKYLLGALDQLICNKFKDLLPKTPHILKALYDLDIVQEEVILQWDEKPNRRTITKELSKELHEKAAPFIKWLKEADEESGDEEEEDEDDDDVEIVYTNQKGGGGLAQVKTETPAMPAAATTQVKVAANKDDDDDLDIDNI